MTETESLYRRGARLVWRFMRAHPGPNIAAVLGAVGFAAAAVSVPIVVGRITDRLITPAFSTGVHGGEVLAGIGILAGFGVLRGMSIIVRRYYAAMVEAAIQRQVRTEVVDTYLDVPLEYHHTHPTGELLAHADADVVGTTSAFRALPFSIGVIALVVFALISLFLVDWTFAVVALVLFPALALFNRRYTQLVSAPVTEVQERLGDLSGVAHESFDGALVVKTLGLEDVEIERFSNAAASLKDAELEVGSIRAGFDPVLDALPNLGTLLLFVVGGWRIGSGAVTPGALVQAALLFSILAFPMRIVGYFLQELPRSVVSIDRIDEVLDEPPAPGIIGAAVRLPDGPLGLVARNLSFSYGAERVLHDVSFEVAPGESVALVGPTGSGKSTLVSLLVRLVEPETGHVEVVGTDGAHVDVRQVDGDELRAAVSLVFQESYLFASTIRENVSLGMASEADVDAAAELARVNRFVRVLDQGWDTVVGERGVTLSGGQRQRVALARAIARRPRALILDDATAAVDPVIEAQILDGLRGQGATLLIVAHRLSTIRLADRVVYLEGGRVLAMGRHDDLAETVPGYQALVRAYESEPSVEGDDDVAGVTR